MKKQILAKILVLSILFSVAVPRRSEAAVGLIVAAPAAITVGAITLSAGALTSVISMSASKKWEDGIVGFVFGALAAGIGLIILEDNSKSMNFAELDQVKASKLDLSAEQVLAYNNELDEINAIKQSIEAEVVKMENPSIEKAHALWQDMRTNISPEAYVALEKISAAFLQ